MNCRLPWLLGSYWLSHGGAPSDRRQTDCLRRQRLEECQRRRRRVGFVADLPAAGESEVAGQALADSESAVSLVLIAAELDGTLARVCVDRLLVVVALGVLGLVVVALFVVVAVAVEHLAAGMKRGWEPRPV